MKKRKMEISRKTTYVKSLLLLVFLYGAFSVSAQALQDTVVTQYGAVSGQVVDSVAIFKGIPYAAAPIGIHRFALPVDHTPWDTVRHSPGPTPSAPFNLLPTPDMDDEPLMGRGWVKGDDYLALNIWAPAHRAARSPVMVYIHGGAFVLGTSDVPLFDGSMFAQKGVVMVSINYRLGIEGFLKIPGVPTNLGLHDQIAALKWVKANITAFGGDTSNITVFGQSAGAMSIAVLAVSPPARGLFHRAIMMSGSGQAVLTSDQANRLSNAYAKAAGVQNTRDGWMTLSSEQLLMAQSKVKPGSVKLKTKAHPDPTAGIAMFFPVIDGEVVPDVPLNMLKQHRDDLDLMIGYNSDEANFFLVSTGLLKKISFDFILRKIVRRVNASPSATVKAYRRVYPKKSRGELLSAIATAYAFQAPSVRFANAHALQNGKTYMYEFAWRSSVAGGSYGAYHGVELPFVFNHTKLVNSERGMLGPELIPAGMADSVQHAFIQFAKTGNPGWAPYSTSKRETMRIDTQWELQTRPHEQELHVWQDGE